MEFVIYIRYYLYDIDIIMIIVVLEIDVVRYVLWGGVIDYIVKLLMFDWFKVSLEGY